MFQTEFQFSFFLIHEGSSALLAAQPKLRPPLCLFSLSHVACSVIADSQSSSCTTCPQSGLCLPLSDWDLAWTQSFLTSQQPEGVCSNVTQITTTLCQNPTEAFLLCCHCFSHLGLLMLVGCAQHAHFRHLYFLFSLLEILFPTRLLLPYFL